MLPICSLTSSSSPPQARPLISALSSQSDIGRISLTSTHSPSATTSLIAFKHLKFSSMMLHNTYFDLYSPFFNMKDVIIMTRVCRFYSIKFQDDKSRFPWRSLISTSILKYVVGDLNRAPPRVLRAWAKRSFIEDYRQKMIVQFDRDVEKKKNEYLSAGQPLSRKQIKSKITLFTRTHWIVFHLLPCLECKKGKIGLEIAEKLENRKISTNPTFSCLDCQYKNIWTALETRQLWGFSRAQLEESRTQLQKRQEELLKQQEQLQTKIDHSPIPQENVNSNSDSDSNSASDYNHLTRIKNELSTIEHRLENRNNFHVFGFEGGTPYNQNRIGIVFFTQDLVEFRRQTPYLKISYTCKSKREFDGLMRRREYLPKEIADAMQIDEKTFTLRWGTAKRRRKTAVQESESAVS